MPLIQKSNPVGIDYHIDKLQKRLYNGIVAKWQFADAALNYDCFPRCYRNKKSQGYVAELYNQAKEYNGDAWWNDSKDIVSFFGLGDKINVSIQNEVPVHLVLFINLEKIKINTSARADEEARRDLINIIGQDFFGFKLQSIDLFLENVLKEYPGTRKMNMLERADYHPLYCVRLNFLLTYDGNTYC